MMFRCPICGNKVDMNAEIVSVTDKHIKIKVETCESCTDLILDNYYDKLSKYVLSGGQPSEEM